MHLHSFVHLEALFNRHAVGLLVFEMPQSFTQIVANRTGLLTRLREVFPSPWNSY
jgi:hypothetical protein